MPAPLLPQRIQRRYNLDMRIKLFMAYGNTNLSDKAISARRYSTHNLADMPE
ncbi:hypothetical protein H257_08777 [Aphanomyces astaci]|uniref:Uncharacterized protein n=1 Tax=Aphanomyces astaci TaxID=112090 RepID=W4GDH6_APHAT|nr:hypothetical protein H257_08777 [Aphanomyces astaci]ETV77331.1 hypothetical protein H257_08777 [Aphanomyces astaci]|eukprot:XP_009833118.1 hypothetical protein H257_08777 [Aphanomyces astaci]